MTHNRTSPPRNLKLIIILTVALVLNAVVLGGLGWCSYRFYRDDALVRQRDSIIKDLRGWRWANSRNFPGPLHETGLYRGD